MTTLMFQRAMTEESTVGTDSAPKSPRTNLRDLLLQK